MGCWVLVTEGLGFPRNQGTAVCRGDKEDQRRPQALRNVIFHFFVPDPKKVLETLIERGSPTSGNSPVPPDYARNLSTETCRPMEPEPDSLPCCLLGFHSICPGLLEMRRALTEGSPRGDTQCSNSHQAAVGIGFSSICGFKPHFTKSSQCMALQVNLVFHLPSWETPKHLLVSTCFPVVA